MASKATRWYRQLTLLHLVYLVAQQCGSNTIALLEAQAVMPRHRNVHLGTFAFAQLQTKRRCSTCGTLLGVQLV